MIKRRYVQDLSQSGIEDSVDTLIAWSVPLKPGDHLYTVGGLLADTTETPNGAAEEATTKLRCWLVPEADFQNALNASSEALKQVAYRNLKKHEMIADFVYTATTERKFTVEFESARAQRGLPEADGSSLWRVLWFARIADDMACDLFGWYDVEIIRPPRGGLSQGPFIPSGDCGCG